jgi:diacylglycerol kinase family enzyme
MPSIRSDARAEAEGESYAPKIGKARRKAWADARSGLPLFTLPVTAPPAAFRLINDPSGATIEPRKAGYLGNLGLTGEWPGMRIFVVVNADGGTVQGGGVDPERLSAELGRAGLDAQVTFSPGAEIRQHAEQALEHARDGRIDAIVVGGGDGTVGTVAGVLTDTGVPLGILPFGTLNHFAKDLGLPLEMEGAVQVIAAAATRNVDVAEVNGRVFINNSSVGIYPYIVRDRERRRSVDGLGKWPAMSLAFLRMLGRFPLRRLRLRAESWAAPYRTPCLFVGNNEYSMELMSLGQRHRLDAGELWLGVVKQRSALGLLWFAARIVFGRLKQAGDFETLRASSLEIAMSASRVAVAVDGEVETMDLPLVYRSRPGALRVIAPPPAPS